MNSFYVIALVLSLARLGNAEVNSPGELLSPAQLAECQPGSEWASECHNCRCDDNGRSTCTKSTDQNCVNATEPLLCKPQTTFERGCHTCVCLATGFVVCTLENCDMTQFTKTKEMRPFISSDTLGTRTSDLDDTNLKKTERSHIRKTRTVSSTQLPLKNCQPGLEFRLDCNVCLCNNIGDQYSCTRIDCRVANGGSGGTRKKREVSQQPMNHCKPGSVFNQAECNVCRCTSDGRHATCTLKRCTPSSKDIQKTGKDVEQSVGNAATQNSKDKESNFRCNPGEQFKNDCNDCTCSADGKSVYCTLYLCNVDTEMKI